MKMMTRRERIEGALWGHLVGDALGVPYEFHDPFSIPPAGQIEFEPPPGFRRSHDGTPPGTWSDDGAMALCLLDSLLDRGRFDRRDCVGRLQAWANEGYLAVDGRVFDIGNQTWEALEAHRAGERVLALRSDGSPADGNGSLMRVLPLALWHRGTDAELVDDARAQSRLTHPHPLSLACCALYCLWARRILDEADDPWARAVATLRALLPVGSPERAALETSVRPDRPPAGTGSGFVADSLSSGRLVLSAGSYEDVVRAAIRLGRDTDTTACIAGGLAGLRDGVGAIPNRWLDELRGKEMVRPLLDRLLEGERGRKP